MKLEEVLKELELLAPLRYAESWDNVGLLVGDPSAMIERVLVTVDYSRAVAEEARARGVQLVVAYHPPMFSAVKRVPHDALWADAIRRNIALYSMHTALDVAVFGTNEHLARVCGVPDILVPLRKFREPHPEDPAGIGLGRAGDIHPTTLRDLVATLKRKLELSHVMVAGSLDAPIKRIAVAAGAGGELLGDAVKTHADVFVTGEIRHHDALSAVARGCNVVALLHSNSERQAVKAYAGRLAHQLRHVEVIASERDAEPFYFA